MEGKCLFSYLEILLICEDIIYPNVERILILGNFWCGNLLSVMWICVPSVSSDCYPLVVLFFLDIFVWEESVKCRPMSYIHSTELCVFYPKLNLPMVKLIHLLMHQMWKVVFQTSQNLEHFHSRTDCMNSLTQKQYMYAMLVIV